MLSKKNKIIALFFAFFIFSGVMSAGEEKNENAESGDKFQTEIIGNEKITFNIPSDKELLEVYYREVIRTYAEAERKNIEFKNALQRYISLTQKLKKDYEKQADTIKKTKEEFELYTKLVNRSMWFAGFGINYTGYITKTHAVSAEFMFAWSTRKLIILGGFPIGFIGGVSANGLNNAAFVRMGLGVRFGILFKLN